MKYYSRFAACAFALAMFLTLAGCQKQDLPVNSQTAESSAEPASVPEASSLTEEEARTLVIKRLPLDFEETCTLFLNNAAREWNGRTYFHFLIENGQIAFETSVLVDAENGQVFTYYPDGSAYAPEDDPFCRSQSGESEVPGEEEAETGLRWSGSYVSENGVVLSIEPQDTTSFEFSLVDPNGNGLENQVARSTGDGEAVSSAGSLTVTFRQQDGGILIETEGSLPPGFAPNGLYAPAE